MARIGSEQKTGVGGMLKLPAALRRDLVLLIAVKLVMLTVLYGLFFSPPHRPAIDALNHIAGVRQDR